ncbi:MAG TPA: GNAT family N-acetyltransferase [Puia sp.]|nr:GNAT family N-acetyltransferase [Puia sp.]
MTRAEEIQDNLYGLYASLAASGLAGAGTVGGFRFIRCADSAWPNMTWSGRQAADALDMAALVAGIKELGCPRLLALEEQALSPGLIAQLQAARFLPAAQWVNMFLDLRDAGSGGMAGLGRDDGFGRDAGLRRDASSGREAGSLECRVIDARHAAEWQGWSGVVQGVLFKHAELAATLFRSGQDAGLLRLIAGYAEGRLVSTSLLYSGALAGVYMVATEPESQGRGYGLQLMHFTASVARERGYDSLVLHSTKSGLPLYNRLGFQAQGKLSLFYCMG